MTPLPRTGEISPDALAALGVPGSAYVRPVEEDGKLVFAIHAAEGTRLAVAPSRDLAFALIRQNDMEPFDAH
ncbi:MAG: DUF1150 family protein [Geminicoccaceae bacterium]